MSAKRASLSSLVSAAAPVTKPDVVPDVGTPDSAGEELTRPLPRLVEDDSGPAQQAKAPPPARTRQGSRAMPARGAAPAPYQRLTRKETRIREQQYDDLTDLARRLNRARSTPGERITENTLIRVAIDLLLERRTELGGETETELRKSVSP